MLFEAFVFFVREPMHGCAPLVLRGGFAVTNKQVTGVVFLTGRVGLLTRFMSTKRY